VTDLHWGKGETFRHHGIPIPDALMDDELIRLSAVLAATGAQRLIVLGDLIHSKIGITEELRKKIAEWRNTFSGQIVVVRGNHDRGWQGPPEWRLDLVTEWKEGPFSFCHEPVSEEAGFVWAGHLHPTFRIRNGPDNLRLPCFHVGKHVGVLPAFNFFTRGVEMPRHKTDRVFVIADDKLFAV